MRATTIPLGFGRVHRIGRFYAHNFRKLDVAAYKGGTRSYHMMQRLACSSLQAALPHNENTPASRTQRQQISPVTRAVPCDFFRPEFLSRSRHLEQSTVV